MRKILFFYPSNKRTVSLETLFKELTNKGYHVSFLSMCERGDLHKELEKHNIDAYSLNVSKGNSLIYYSKLLFKLILFCRKNQIDIVFSHLQTANLVAILANFVVKAKVIVFRHHDFSRTRNESIGDKIINKLAKTIVVPSSGVKNLMLQNESVSADKLLLIPYMYDFSSYHYPDQHEVSNLRNQYTTSEKTLLLIMVARFVTAKRHALVLQIIYQLIDEGHDLQLLLLDEGPEKIKLINTVNELKLQDHVHFIGFTRQVTQYLAASDLMLHPSFSEASNSAVKEAGLLKRAVAVCENVGDFSDYIENGVNGYLMNKDDPRHNLKEIIKTVYHDRSLIDHLGEKLNKTVKNKFSLNENILNQYDKLIDDSDY